MTAREIADLFFQLELILIASLKRNLARHKAWEKQEGFDWETWQSAKLRDIRRFQKENRKEVEKFASVIDKETRQLIEDQYQEGGADGFFSMNDRRMNALLDEMQTAQQQVEKAALRYMDDIYRKTVHTAALGMATGSMTLQQATDAATKEFLAAGINCIQYKNGRRVNIASYAEMALRTAATRATLMGEAKLRESMDIDTVLVSQYGACSETCLPWQGLVYIDDVWQDYTGPHTPGGTYGISRNGHQYPLLSVAVKNGLFHPNCRHTLTTWFDGISTRPKPMDKAQIERTSKLEKQQRAMERDVRALKRLAAGTQDADQAAAYRKEVRAAQKKLKAFVDENGDALRRDYWRERYDEVPLQEKRAWVARFNKQRTQKDTQKNIQTYKPVLKESKKIETKNGCIHTHKVRGYDPPVYLSDKTDLSSEEIRAFVVRTKKAMQEWEIPQKCRPTIIIAEFEENGLFGAYDAKINTVRYSSVIKSAKDLDLLRTAYHDTFGEGVVPNFGDTERHEMWHLQQAQRFRNKGWKITPENYSRYLTELRKECKSLLAARGIKEYTEIKEISAYAAEAFSYGAYDEVEAEYMVKHGRRKL